MFLELQSYFLKKAVPERKSKNALEPRLPFEEAMSPFQLKKFNQGLLKVDHIDLKGQISYFESKGVFPTEDMCPCQTRMKIGIPCCHMLQRFKDKCRSQLQLSKYEAAKNISSDEVDSDDNIMEMLEETGDTATREEKRQFEEELQVLFMKELANHHHYDLVVRKEADIEELMVMNREWTETLFNETEDSNDNYLEASVRSATSTMATDKDFLKTMVGEFITIFVRMKFKIKNNELPPDYNRKIFNLLLAMDENLKSAGFAHRHGITPVNVQGVLDRFEEDPLHHRESSC